MDERLETYNFHTSHYQGTSWSAPIILDGKIHWSPRYTTHGNQGWQAIDLYTGETIFTNYTTQIPSMGSIYLYESPNQHGGFAYLWRTSGVTIARDSSGTQRSSICESNSSSANSCSDFQ